LNVDQIGRINAILKRAWRYHLTGDIYDVVGLLDYVDSRLFKSVQNEHHCLNHLLPPIKPDGVNLRSRGHRFVLPRCKFEFYRKSYFPRCLYNFI
jgi:hypothetical protein